MKKRTKPSLTSVIALILIVTPLAYVLSYKPSYRIIKGNRRAITVFPGRQSWQGAFVPVEWMIDDTPLRAPLLAWGRVWDVNEELTFESNLRTNRVPD